MRLVGGEDVEEVKECWVSTFCSLVWRKLSCFGWIDTSSSMMMRSRYIVNLSPLLSDDQPLRARLVKQSTFVCASVCTLMWVSRW